MKIAVLGAGNGGLAMSAHMTMKGYDVSLYDKFPEVLKGLQKAKGVYLKGVAGDGFAPISIITSDISEAIKDCELIMVVTPAFAHRSVAQDLASSLESSQIVMLHPGRTGGAIEVKNVIKEKRPELNPIVAEAQTLLYASRKTSKAEVTIYGIKNRVAFSALPAKYNDLLKEKLQKIFPQFYPVSNVWETSLLNIGAVFHPTPSILNCARIEDTGGDFEYYHQGITPAVSKVLEKIDQERVNVAKAFGVKTLTTVEWIKEVYSAEGKDIYTAVQANKVYSGIGAPDNIKARYISEDVPMSLVPISELGKIAGVETRTIDLMISLANILHGTDYRKKGRNINNLGISSTDVEELKSMVV